MSAHGWPAPIVEFPAQQPLGDPMDLDVELANAISRRDKLFKLLQIEEANNRLEERLLLANTIIFRTANIVLSTIYDSTGVGKVAIMSRNRCEHVASARMLAYVIFRKLDFSYSDIGRLFKRDHAAVWHGVKAMASRFAVDTSLKDRCDKVFRLCQERLNKI